MNTIDEIPLVDLIIAAEKMLERKLAVCLVIHPKEVLEKAKGYSPEIDIPVIKYWNSVSKRRSEILRADPDQAHAITLNLALNVGGSSFWLWWDVLADKNSFLAIDNTLADIRALRIARKAANYIQKNRILEPLLQGVIDA